MKSLVILFSSHLKLESLNDFLISVNPEDECIFLTSHKLFPNESRYLNSIHSKSKFICFADLLTDEDMEMVDISADEKENKHLIEYYEKIKIKKNECVLNKLKNKFDYEEGYIFSDDLGIEEEIWIRNGFKRKEGSYYYKEDKVNTKISFFQKIKFILLVIKQLFNSEVYVARNQDQKYVFYGKMNRIAYRLDLDFRRSRKEQFLIGLEKLYIKLINKNGFRRNIKRLTTFHEYQPIGLDTELNIIQDGYLSPNYTSLYMKYFKGNVSFLTWDKMGMQTFINQNLPASIIPFRKILLLPKPVFPKKVKKILCVTSGAGDWTAMKNRSDEDSMVLAFAQIAQMYPDIEFIYRCHPVWVVPQHQGVNSINRVADFFDDLGLSNLHLSSNVPSAYTTEGNLVLSYRRSSLEDDLKDVDLVFGEHSISMVDGAFKKIVFASVNMTGRRDFFIGLTDLGFPHCENIEEIKAVIDKLCTNEFKQRYLSAIDNYNNMSLSR